MQELRIAGRRLCWREAGSGPPVMLAHCSLGHSGLWRPVMKALADEFHLVVPDLPAHGRSDPPPEGVSLQLHAVELLAALMDRIGAPAHLVGLSLGGALMGRLALARPQAVQSLTLIEPVWFHLLADAGHPAAGSPEFDHAKLGALCERGAFAEAARLFMEEWGMRGQFDAMKPADRDKVARSLSHLHRDFPMVVGHPPGQIGLDDIARLPDPLLLVSGSETQAISEAVIEVIAAHHPQARRRRIAGAGHLSPVTHPREVTALLRQFFTEPRS